MANQIRIVEPPFVTIQGKDSADTTLTFQADDGTTKKLEVPRGTSAERDFTSCENIRLINAALGQKFAISPDATTRAQIAEFERDCTKERVNWPPGFGEIDPHQDPAKSDALDPNATTPATQTGAPF